MKEKEIYLGIDVSKATLDICLIKGQATENITIKNQSKSIGSFFTRLKKKYKDARLLVCMENTGYYNWPLYEAVETMALDLYVINALHLKRSMGLVRGKSDAIDAQRIARFIVVHHKELKPSLIPSPQIRRIQALLAHRKRLIETRKRFSVPAQELEFIDEEQMDEQMQDLNQRMVKEINAQVKSLEGRLKALIKSDTELDEQFKYLTSVQGVGKVLAWYMIVKTNQFKSINEPRKLACYAGVVPFDYQSGTSINKKPRVSFMADKTLKKLLHMAAMRAIQLKGDLQTYYQRKVAIGKNKMLVLNAIRNKIVARICAVVKNKRFYQNDLLLS